MKRIVSSATVAILLACLFSIVIAGNALAQHRGPEWHHHQKSEMSTKEISEYCRAHPDKCVKHKTNDPRTNTKRQRCMDSKGNRDGFISSWERETFSHGCR